MDVSIAKTAIKSIIHQASNIKDYTIINKLIDASKDGMTTREIANSCGLSIYSARTRLLKLEEYCFVSREKTTKGILWFFDTHTLVKGNPSTIAGNRCDLI